jgi:cytidylate kinase
VQTLKKIVIAIDGFSSCGKSTLAKELAKELNYIFIDSGAMYRGVTLFALQRNLITKNKIDRHAIIKSLEQVELSFLLNQETKSPELHLNGVNIAKENGGRSTKNGAKWWNCNGRS